MHGFAQNCRPNSLISKHSFFNSYKAGTKLGCLQKSGQAANWILVSWFSIGNTYYFVHVFVHKFNRCVYCKCTFATAHLFDTRIHKFIAFDLHDVQRHLQARLPRRLGWHALSVWFWILASSVNLSVDSALTIPIVLYMGLHINLTYVFIVVALLQLHIYLKPKYINLLRWTYMMCTGIG